MEVKADSKKEISVTMMRVTIKGRIEAHRRYEGKSYTHIMTPAPDAYSRPQLVEVRSSSKIADKGEEVTVTAILGGYSRKPYQVTDKSTGERVNVTPVDHTLDLVE